MLAVVAPETHRVLPVVRGLAVGLFAALAAIGGHLLAMPDDAPGLGTLVFLLGVCGALGTAVGTTDQSRRRPGQIIAVLGAAQILGHLALSIGAAHSLTAPNAAMLAAHAAALAVGVVVVDAADRACRRALALLNRLLCTDAEVPAASPRTWALIVADTGPHTRRDAIGHHIRRGPPALTAPLHP